MSELFSLPLQDPEWSQSGFQFSVTITSTNKGGHISNQNDFKAGIITTVWITEQCMLQRAV